MKATISTWQPDRAWRQPASHVVLLVVLLCLHPSAIALEAFFEAQIDRAEHPIWAWQEGDSANATNLELRMTAEYESFGIFSHRISPTLVVFRDSLWDDASIIRTLGAAARIFAQCDIAIAPARLVFTDLPAPFTAVSEDTDGAIAARSPAVDPAIYFFRSHAGQRHGSYGYIAVEGEPRAGTVWIASEYRDDFGGIAIAHELGHLLCNCANHVDDRFNLMTARVNLGSRRLTDEQCTVFRRSRYSRTINENALSRGR